MDEWTELDSEFYEVRREYVVLNREQVRLWAMYFLGLILGLAIGKIARDRK